MNYDKSTDLMPNPTAQRAPLLHEGELEVQARLGVREQVAPFVSHALRPFMPEQHRELFGKLPTLMVGSLDAQQRPWASVLAGPPGFIQSPDERHLRILARPDAGDPLSQALRPGVPLGLLGLEPHTRRRNRMNGSVIAHDGDGFTVEVDLSFGNCPKYIQARVSHPVDRGVPPPACAEGPQLSAQAQRLVASADTVFIASAAAAARAHAGAQGVDVSHRGGLPGFVHLSQADDGGTLLTLPDFRGNNLFNTLGNLSANPQAGLLFIDPDQGDLLQLTGTAQILWNPLDGVQGAPFVGAQRFVQLRVTAGWWRAGALPLRWTAPEFSAHLLASRSAG